MKSYNHPKITLRKKRILYIAPEITERNLSFIWLGKDLHLQITNKKEKADVYYPYGGFARERFSRMDRLVPLPIKILDEYFNGER